MSVGSTFAGIDRELMKVLLVVTKGRRRACHVKMVGLGARRASWGIDGDACASIHDAMKLPAGRRSSCEVRVGERDTEYLIALVTNPAPCMFT